jgi:hypothetical protein
VRRRHASHITVVLSKAAHSGPSVCLRERAPCPLRVSCPGTDRAERAAQAAGVSVQCKLQVLALPCLRWSRHQELPALQRKPILSSLAARRQSLRTRTGGGARRHIAHDLHYTPPSMPQLRQGSC